MLHKNILSQFLLWLFVTILVSFLFVYLEKNSQTLAIKLTNKSLNQQTIELFDSLDNELTLEIYSEKSSAISKKIAKFLNPFQRLKDDFKIVLIEPSKNPAKVRTNAVTVEGEMILSYQDQIVHITELSESALVNAILSVQRNQDEWLVLAEGYEMLSVTNEDDSGLLNFLISLNKLGVKVARMQLNSSLQLPDNVKIIALPRPKQTLESDIVNWLKQQMDKGISIWWLTDPEVQNSQTQLELLFDVMVGSKQIIEDDQYTGTLSSYLDHAITDRFNQPIYMSEAAEIISENSNNIINTKNNSTLALSKTIDNSRVVVFGDVDLITNQFINVAANKNFIVRTLDWLFYHDDRINMAIEVRSDTQLHLNRAQILILSLVLLIGIPLFYMLLSLIQWRRSRVG